MVSAYRADPAGILNSMMLGCTALGTGASLCENNQNTTSEGNIGRI